MVNEIGSTQQTMIENALSVSCAPVAEDERLLFDVAPAPLALVSVDGVVLCANAAAAGFFGYSDADGLVGCALASLLHDGELEGEGPKRWRRTQGGWRWAALRWSAPGADGTRMASWEDAQAAVALSEHVRRLEARFQCFADAATDWFWETDEQHRITFLSERFESVTGLSRDIFVGAPRQTDADSPDEAEAWRRHRSDLEAHRPFRDFVYSRAAPDGKRRSFRVSGAPVFTLDGRFLGYRGCAADVTEVADMERAHRESEARLRDAVNSLADGFVLWDADDRLVVWNERYEQVLPRLAPHLRVGLAFDTVARLSVQVGDVLVDDLDAWMTDRRKHHDAAQGSMEQRLADGRWLLIQERRTSDGGSVGLRIDITDRKRAEEQLIAARDAAERANRAKTTFMAVMSHELRTPLNAVIGFADLIRQEAMGPVGAEDYVHYAERIHASGQHLLSLINDILDIARIESGGWRLDETIEDLGVLIDDCLLVMESRATEAGVTLARQGLASAPLRLDARAVRQVLLNLLTNAVKFTNPGGHVTATLALADDGAILAHVGDDGVGIPPEALARVMEPFQMAADPLSRNRDGTGLGLSISRGLMALHGGALSLTSTVGVGTVVTMRFPSERTVVSYYGVSSVIS